MSELFTPLTIRSIEFRNRVWVSPMCQYSAVDGVPDDWHLVHLGSRAVGGAGLVVSEATAVTPDGRISPADTGIWNEEQVEAWRRITAFISAQGSVPGIQLAHAGRKASTQAPWDGHDSISPDHGGWTTRAPSALPFADYATPREMTSDDLDEVRTAFVEAARRSLDAGFQVIELHAAHGYLLHEFLSPLSNERTDEYGGSFGNRIRFVLEVARDVRAAWPDELPLFVRVSASDWVEGGWTLEESVELARSLGRLGVDLIDSSSGGLDPAQQIAVGPGYQVPFAETIRAKAEILTAAVGLITDAGQAEQIVASGQADAVFLARESLRDPYFPLHAAARTGDNITWPTQYARAKPA